MLKKYIDLIIGFLLIFYFFIINTMSFLRFKYLFLVLGMFCFIYHFTKKYLIKKEKLYKFAKKILMIFISIFILVESIMVFYPKQNLNSDCDYIIVLGALVNKTSISKSLQDRLDTCIEYLNKTKQEKMIIVSGGRGRGEDITEASAMKDYLVSKGINKDMIIMEDKSKTTKENFDFSKKIIENLSNKKIEDLKIKVITTDFHTLRSKIISRKSGYKQMSFYTSKSNSKLAILNYTREFFALISNIVLNY